MKLVIACLALVFLATASSAAAQTTSRSNAEATHSTLSATEIAKRLSGLRRGSGGFNITPQEKAREEAGMAKTNELNHAAEEALHLKNFAVAEADYRELIQMGTLAYYSYYGLGEALAGQGKTADALAVYKIAVYWPLNTGPEGAAISRSVGNPSNLRGCSSPQDAVAWMKYALLLSRTGQNGEALSVYSQAVRHANDTTRSGISLAFEAGPPSPTELQAAAHVTLGLLTPSTGGDPEQAMAEFDQARRLMPDAAVTNYYYGYGWQRLGLQSKTRMVDAPQAKAALQKAALADDAAVKKAAGEALLGLQ